NPRPPTSTLFPYTTLFRSGKIPDLVLIDGGKGQVSAAKAAMVELGMNDIAVVGIAKGPERRPGLEELIIESEARTLQLPPSHPRSEEHTSELQSRFDLVCR